MKRRTKRKLFALGVILFLIGGGGLFWGPVKSGFDGWRFNSMLEKAHKAVREGKLSEARRFASSAWKLSKLKLDNFRRLADLGEELNWREESLLMEALYYMPESTVEDQVRTLRYFISRSDMLRVSRLLDGLSPDRRKNPQILLCEAEGMAALGRTVEAIEAAKKVLKSKYAPRGRYLLSSLLPRLPSNELAWREAAQLIEILMLGDDKDYAIGGFRNLRNLAPKYRILPNIESVAIWLEGRDGVTAKDRFLATEIDIFDAPKDRRDEVIELVIEQEVEEDGGSLGRWLLEMKEGERLLNIPDSVVLADTNLYVAYLQVLIDKGLEDEAMAWMAQAPQGVSLTILEGLKAGLARKRGDEFARVVAWGKAFDSAARLQQYGEYMALLMLAEHFNDQEVAKRAATDIAGLPSQHLPESSQLSYLKKYFEGDVEFLVETYNRFLTARPKNAIIQHEYARLIMVTEDGETEEEATAWAEIARLAQRYPQILPFQCSYAMSLVEKGDKVLALKHLQGQDTNWNEAAQALDRAAYALVLRANGKESMATNMELGVVWDEVPAYEGLYFHQNGVRVPSVLWKKAVEKDEQDEE